MSTILFLILALAFISLGTTFCLIYRPGKYYIFFLALLNPLFINYSSITFFPVDIIKMNTPGLEVTLQDLCMIVLLFVMLLRPKEFSLRLNMPLIIPYSLIILISLFSWGYNFNVEISPFLDTWLYPFFETWKFVRMLLTYLILANFLTSPKSFKTLIYALMTLVFIFSVHALIQRYIFKINTPNGGLIHRHVFGFFIGSIGTFLYPFFFHERSILKKTVIALSFLGCLGCILLTQGRSNFAGFLIVTTLMTPFLLYRYFSLRNLIVVGLVGVFAFIPLVAKSYHRLSSRFETSDINATIDEREIMWRFAMQLGETHPVGVGLGNFSAYAHMIGWQKSIAHNTFYLLFAELGVPGVFLYFWLYGEAIVIGAYALFFRRLTDFHVALLVASTSVIMFLLVQDLFHYSTRYKVIIFIPQICFAYISRIVKRPSDLDRVEDL